MRWFFALIGLTCAIAGFLAASYFWPGTLVMNSTPAGTAGAGAKRMAERIREAEARSQNVRGVYMTSDVANDGGIAATRLRNGIIGLLDATELDAVVIDVKETRGGLIITDRLRELIKVLHGKGAWVIARQVVFKDSSQERAHPEWYLKRTSGGLWRDNRGGSWLDQASPEVWAYQLAAARAASDAGFDEIQFDYIRFPSDGDVRSIIYPVYDGQRPKYEVLREFFAYLSSELKRHRPDLILSADLFGYVALQQADLGIGQRLEDIGESFDYISLMVYPSHYYAGFQAPADPSRNLAAIFYPYRSSSVAAVAPNQPYDVVHRSLLIAADVLEGRTATTALAGSVASSSLPLATPARSKTAKLRPWLQDFDLGVDSARGIRYDAAKVRAQIDAAEAAGSAGWLLWSPDNVYTREALKPE